MYDVLIDGAMALRDRGAGKRASKHGKVPIPGSAQIALPKGKVKLWYQESRRLGSGDGSPFGGLADLEVDIRGEDGTTLEVKRPRALHVNQMVSKKLSIDLFGTVTVPAAGEYNVTATGTPGDDAVEPVLALGK